MDAQAQSQDLREKFNAAGQGQVFRFWEDLSETQREGLLQQASEIDLSEVDGLYQNLVMGGAEEGQGLDGLEPAPYMAHPSKGGDLEAWKKAFMTGEDTLKAGKVAAFTVAGGQGTRLGYDGPKGTFPVTPVKQKSLFQVFAEKIRAANSRYGCSIPWLIMTSHINHHQTVNFFQEHDYFGLDANEVWFFSQGRMPAVDADGKIILEAPDKIAMSPDGHGGALRALVRSGSVARLQERGISVLSYFQVDNVLVRAIDPAFIGFHVLESSEMSSKMIPKRDASEKLGIFCVQDGQTKVIEYSDMPAEMQAETDENGVLRYLAGSIAIHVLDVEFVNRVGSGGEFQLPFHRAHKKIPTATESGETVKPEEPNGYKFEMFVFDALPFAKNATTIETLREDDFSPVKNAEGSDSPQTAKDDQLRQFARWAEAAGVRLEVDETEKPAFDFEVSPLFADSEAAFVTTWRHLDPKPTLEHGTYLE
ncbi:MAG: UDP-N-acetylglucosamine pyrophosphorylase [Puniceicoccaceae bacterium 5H]|nr:MAG: UDP-N-acetylglucosamine pyrophosphorylase [Puniceicoccaceae bacterium 5H]